jgi:hypothetical protein
VSHVAARLCPVASNKFEFSAPVWEWDGKGAWHFVSLPEDVADEIDDLSRGRTGGFGSVRVEVQVGNSIWQTSLFPDRKRGTYLLPMKKTVRKAEQLEAGSIAKIELTVIFA